MLSGVYLQQTEIKTSVLGKFAKKAFWKTYSSSLCNIFHIDSVYNKKKLRGFSPLANCTDRAIAAGQRS
jgi:hypothetical protein